jgi:hypothetical protein
MKRDNSMANGIVLPRHRKLLDQVKKEMRERGELTATSEKEIVGQQSIAGCREPSDQAR